MCSSRLWICEACEKPAPCLWTDWVENRPGHFRPQVLHPHRAVVFEERVEGVVADPGFVPQDVVAEVADLLQNLADVVDGAVVGRELDAGEPERALCLVPLRVLHQRVGADLLAQIVLVPGAPVDGADHAEGIARRRQEDRDRAGLHQRALVQRFVIVAVEQDEIAALEHGVRHDLVGGARPVQDEVGLVGAEHPRGVALRLHRRTFVDEEIAEIDIGVAQIVAEDVLAEMLEEQLAGGRLPVELAALMSGAVEGDVCLAVIRHQPAEERRQQRLSVHQQAGDDLLGVEGRGLLAEVDIAVDLAGLGEHRHVGELVGIGQRPQAACGTRSPRTARASLRAPSRRSPSIEAI